MPVIFHWLTLTRLSVPPEDQRLSLIVRNQPAGSVELVAVDRVRRPGSNPTGRSGDSAVDPTIPDLSAAFQLRARQTGPSGIVSVAQS